MSNSGDYSVSVRDDTTGNWSCPEENQFFTKDRAEFEGYEYRNIRKITKRTRNFLWFSWEYDHVKITQELIDTSLREKRKIGAVNLAKKLLASRVFADVKVRRRYYDHCYYYEGQFGYSGKTCNETIWKNGSWK